MEKVVLTQEEMDSLKNIQDAMSQITLQFGQIEVAIQSLELQKDSLIQALTSLRTQEVEIGKSLQEKYGDGVIDINTGEFTKQS